MFTAEEVEFLVGQRLGRIATASSNSEPDVAPVGFSLDDGVIVIDGFDNTKTRKYHNIKANPRASFVVDDLASVDPWRPRGVKVSGRAEIAGNEKPTLRITPETIWSWGINPNAPKVFAGMIEKRPASEGSTGSGRVV